MCNMYLRPTVVISENIAAEKRYTPEPPRELYCILYVHAQLYYLHPYTAAV